MRAGLKAAFIGAVFAAGVVAGFAGSDSAAPEPWGLAGGRAAWAVADPELRLLESDRVVPEVVDRVTPAVVSIFSTRELVQRPFNPFLPFGPGGGREHRFHQQGMGSGVIVDADGVILTNNHVVDKADKIKVVLSDEREFEAKVAGRDAKTDVAVLRIDAKGLPVVSFGDSSKVRVGQNVLAVGNPMGVGLTVSRGIISARSRAGMGLVDYEEFLQTDAAINPGNSGGAMVNLKGELVGINTAIVSRSGGFQGIGFAIPSNLARRVMEILLKDGKVSRGQLGVLIQDLTPSLAKALGDNAPVDGVIVSEVLKGGAAEKAGMKRGDVIVKLDGNPVTSMAVLRNRISLKGAGSRVNLEVWRDGKTKEIKVTLKALDEGAVARRSVGSEEDEGKGNASGLPGIEVATATPQMLGRMGLDRDFRGVVITSIDEKKGLGWTGLREGDLIIEVNRKPVETPEDMRRRVRKSGDSVLLTVRRRDGTLYVAVSRR